MKTRKFQIIEVDGGPREAAPEQQTPRDQRKREVIAAAIDVFASDGYAAFSARSVAKKLEVSLSTVQHYFPNREILLVETLREMGSGYIEKYRATIDSQELSPTERLQIIVDHLLEETQRPDVRAFFFQMWASAQHEPGVRALLEAMTADYRLLLKNVVRQITPAFKDEEAAVAGTLIAAQIEGLMVMTCFGDASLPKMKLLVSRAKQVCLDLCVQNGKPR
ncbi:MAG: hypothetical protein A3I66_04675 [Burkholderiales bacterium RIFCSPLOWO2_02_FULL_57_36]|nr:MAG: hypothetical protein A3I66_04675 [Burkholderiales bacterium RIFCSPLOWO2_02_FULL_57_36]